MRAVFWFFFSSRRRHTRLQGDWSSDVCSSDLAFALERLVQAAGLVETLQGEGPFTVFAPTNDAFAALRSEERRVGKEWRKRGSQEHEKKRNTVKMRKRSDSRTHAAARRDVRSD